MDENNNKQVVRNTVKNENVKVQAPIEEQENVLDINAVNMRMEEDDFVDEKALAHERQNAKLKLLLDNVPENMPESYIESAGFATTFNTQLGSWKRLVKSDLRGSRLRQKAENATLIKDDSHEYAKARKEKLSLAKKYIKKKLREQTKNKKLELTNAQEKDVEFMMTFMKSGKSTVDKDLMKSYVADPKAAFRTCIKSFMEIDISTLKLNYDEDFAKATKKLREIMDRVEVMKAVIRKYPDLVDEQGPEFLEKVEHLDRLSGYCASRENLLLNSFYITHYNDEMTYLSKKDLIPEKEEDDEDDDGKKELRKLDKRDNARQEVSNLIYAVEMSSYFFKNGYNTDSEEGRKEFERLYSKKLSEKQVLSTMNSFVKKSKTIEGAGGTYFGWTLQFFNWLIGDKRRTDFGEAMYDESVKKLDLLPQNIKDLDGTNPLIKEHGAAPALNLEGYIFDPVKAAMSDELKNAPEPGSTDPDYMLAYKAVKNWTMVKGIVNQDTTRMEMAFSDRFLKASKRWLDANPGADQSGDPYHAAKYQFLQNINAIVSGNLYGGLGTEIGEETVEKLKKNLPVLKEDNTYLENVKESNVKDIPLFLHTPTINDVKQAAVGDCWLQSGIQALVASSPIDVKSMFLDLGDGSVLVRLYQLRDKNTGESFSDYKFASENMDRFQYSPLFIRLSKDYEESDGYANDCLWVQLLERAVAASGMNGQRLVKINGNKVTNTTSEITCGSPEAAMAMLTGRFWRMRDKEKKYELPKLDTEKEFAFMLVGLPAKMKDEIIEKIEDERKKNPNVLIDQEKLLGYVKEAEDKYVAECDDVLKEYGEACALYKTFVDEKQLKDMPDIGASEENLKEVMWYSFVKGGVTEYVKYSLTEMERGTPRRFTIRDNFDYVEAIGQLKELCMKIKNEISAGDAAKVGSAVTNLTMLVSNTIPALNATGANLEKALKPTKKQLFGNVDMETLTAVNRHAVMRTRYNVKGYKPAKLEALICLRDTLRESGGAIPVTFGNHCMTVLDTKYENGRWFVLIRDPFNIYNRKYTEKRGKLSCNSTGFFSVFRKEYYDKKRHLTEAGDGSNFRSGFRGLSWWTFDDYYKEYTDYTERMEQ